MSGPSLQLSYACHELPLPALHINLLHQDCAAGNLQTWVSLHWSGELYMEYFAVSYIAAELDRMINPFALQLN